MSDSQPTSSIGLIASPLTERGSAGSIRLRSGVCPCQRGRRTRTKREWLQSIIEAAEAGLSPSLATMKLAKYGNANMDLALRGLELKTLDPISPAGGYASCPPWATSRSG